MFIIYGGLFFLLFGRILFIQATGEAEGRVMATLAEAKYARESLLQSDRGSIVDRNGELIAADTLSYRMVAVLDETLTKGAKTPRHVVNPEKTATFLADYIPLSKEELMDRLSQDKKQVEFGSAGRDISHETYLAIKKEELPGILFVEDKKRFYPNGSFASYLIGFAVKEEDEEGNVQTIGKMGLESTYNKELTGTDGKVQFESDRWGFILPKSEKAIQPAQDGYEIQLTIDKTIENFVEDALNRVEEEYSPDKMLAVVMNPKTGEILAMSQRPTFDPATREGLTGNWLNEAVENTIEPGSTMKMFTLAAAIEENKWDPNAFFKSGQYTVFDKTIRDHNRTGWGMISFLEGFQRSSNVSMAYLLERMGDNTFLEYIQNFGFGEKTGLNLPNETPGIILSKNPSERLTTTYGQGSTVTPIQMLQAATAIANDGVMMQPYVIDAIINPNTNEVVKDNEPVEKSKPISAETAKQVKEILASTVTSDVGSGRGFALNGYTMGGKTGTAELPSPRGGYLAGGSNYLYSFLGMAPAEDPQLITYVTVQHPKLKAGDIGHDPVSKLFTSIMENSLKYLNIVPEGEDPNEAIELADYTNKDALESIEQLKVEGFKPVLIGEGGPILGQYPVQGVKLAQDTVVILKSEGQITLPDFTGWSKKMVLSYKMLSGLDIRINGDGYVTSQGQSAGIIAEIKEPIVINFQEPFEIYKEVNEEEAEETIAGG
ncbi:penicillin-binding transpeptidase domain-containing protein [Sporosarcina sp. CAU 1771]